MHKNMDCFSFFIKAYRLKIRCELTDVQEINIDIGSIFGILPHWTPSRPADMLLFQLITAFVGLLFWAQPSLQAEIVLPPPINAELIGEALVFIDPKGLEKYRAEEATYSAAVAAAKEDAEYLITAANTYYESLRKYGLNLQIRLVNIELLSRDLVYGKQIWDGDVVSQKTLLSNFERFLRSSALRLNKYDFAILFTGYDLQNPVAGVAELGSVCLRYGCGVVEFRGGFSSASVFSHEVGHIFGSDHDLEDSPYIMAPNASNADDVRTFEFSKRTADFILKHFRTQSVTCLTKTSPSSTVPNVTPESYTGRMQDVNVLCKRVQGPRSTPCTNSFFYNNKTTIAGDSVCFHVACRKPDSQECVHSIKTPVGMPCGLNRACKRGKCVISPSAKTRKVNNQCLFGDDKNPTGAGLSCPAYVKQQGGQYCANATQFSNCCETCPRYATGLPDCPYGNAATIILNDVKKSCAQIMAESGRNRACPTVGKSCCGTCHIPDILKGAQCPYGDDNTVDINNEKLTCEETFLKYGGKGKMCANSFVAQSCCKSCIPPPGSSKECPYGDAAKINVNGGYTTCAEAIAEFSKNNLCANTNLAQQCCKSCGDNSGSTGSNNSKGSGSSDSNNSDCSDLDQLNVNGMDMNCAGAIQKFTKTLVCSNATLKKACCKSCFGS